MKICPVRAELLHVDRRTDRHGEANGHLWQFLRTRLKMLHVVLFGYMLLFYRNVTSALGENFCCTRRMGLLWVSRLVSGFPQLRLVFCHTLIHMGFFADKMLLRRFLPRVVQSSSCHYHSTICQFFYFIYPVALQPYRALADRAAAAGQRS